MRIEINGTPQEVEADTLDAVLEELGHPHESVATALNGEFVARGERVADPGGDVPLVRMEVAEPGGVEGDRHFVGTDQVDTSVLADPV